MIIGPPAWVVCSECRHLYDGREQHDCNGLQPLTAREIAYGQELAGRLRLLVPPTGVEPA